MSIIALPYKTAAALFAGLCLIAGDPDVAAQEPTPGPPIWSVSDDDTVIYLFGLPNLMSEDVQWRNGVFDAALAGADVVVLEADRASPEAQALVQQAIPQIGVYRDGRTLSSVLDDDTRARTEAVSASLGIPFQALDQLKPWLAANQLQSVMVQGAGLMEAPTPGAVISMEAARSGGSLVYLEGPIDLLEAVGALPESSQIGLFEQALEMIENDPEQPRRVLTAWATGDLDALAEAFHGAGAWPDEAVRSAMLVDRNARWQAAIESRLENDAGVIFVAVGIGHLVGPDSLVRELAAAGYQVTRL